MERLQLLLQKYWSDDITDDQREELLALLDQQTAALPSQTMSGDPADQILLSDSRSQAVLQRLHDRIAIAETPVRKIGIPRKTWMTAAAAVLALIITSAILFRPQHISTKNTTAVMAAAAKPAPVNDFVSIHNTSRSIRQLQLADGSVIALYPSASLQYQQPFAKNDRNISLEGKAIFTVAKDPAKPFVVLSNHVTTTVLGTKFMINTHGTGDRTQIRLLEGKVMVRYTGATAIYLIPGQEFLAANADGQSLVRSFISPSHPSPAANTRQSDPAALEFTRMSLADVFRRVGRRYNVSIRCDDAAVNRLTFTGKFLPSDSLEVILNVICNTNDLLFQQQDSLVTIRKMN